MRIAHVISGYFPEVTGGTQTQLEDLCAHQNASHEVAIFTRSSGNQRDEFTTTQYLWNDVEVTSVENRFSDCDRFEKLYAHPKIDAAFDRFLDAFRPDIIHIHHLTCLSTSIIEVAKSRKLPIVMWLADYWLVCLRGQRLYPLDWSICETLDRKKCLPCLQRLWPHLLERTGESKLRDWDQHIWNMLDLCDMLISPSRFHADRFIEHGVPQEKMRVVEYGLRKNDLLAPPRGKAPIRSIGYIGSIIPSKGLHLLLRALNILARPDLSLEIYGEVTPYHEYQGYQAELGSILDPTYTVRYHGRYDHHELPKILANIDLLVVPSVWWESYCITAREGATAGVPVICFDGAGGLSEAIDKGMALGCKLGDPGSLAQAIAKVCDDPELREKLSSKSDLVRDIADNARQIESIYLSLLPDQLN